MSGTQLIKGRICACKDGTYYDTAKIICASSETVFNADNLLLELEYTFYGIPVVYRMFPVSAEDCFSSSKMDGYRTPDHRCVQNCAGRYKPGTGRMCACLEPESSGRCAMKCGDGYVLAHSRDACV